MRGRDAGRGGRVTLNAVPRAMPGDGSFASLRMTRGQACIALLAVLAGLPSRPLAAQVHGQHWEVTPQAGRATVGDPVTIRFRVRLDERDLLFDTMPRPALTPPDWVRILSVEKLQRQPDRIFTGHARIAFYRPGRQPVPIFQLPFMRSVKGLSRGTLFSDSATVEIAPVLQVASSGTLRDIKEPVRPPGPDPLELALGLGVLAAAGWLARRARHRTSPAVPVHASVPSAAPPPPLDPYGIALDRLAAIEAERWAEREVACHYERITDALRDYLEAYGVPARERTTSELSWMMPPGLLVGSVRRRYEDVFEEADLVKFAHWRPGAEEAAEFLHAARDLLGWWRATQMGILAAPVEPVGEGWR